MENSRLRGFINTAHHRQNATELNHMKKMDPVYIPSLVSLKSCLSYIVWFEIL
jgi:hypothetical protein